MANKISRKNIQPEAVYHKGYMNPGRADQALQGGKPPIIPRKEIEVPDDKGVKVKTTVPVEMSQHSFAKPKKVKKMKKII